MQNRQDQLALNYIAICVKDLEKSMNFYCGILGLQRVDALCHLPGNPKAVWLKAGETYLSLISAENPGEALPVTTGVGLYPQGFHHQCFSVENIEAFYKEVSVLTCRIERTLQVGTDGNRQFWLRDPDGYPVEFMELSMDGMQMSGGDAG